MCLNTAVAVSLCVAECGLAPGQGPLRQDRSAPAAAADFPWQARLLRAGRHLCDATLIDNQWLVSAAACFQGSVHTRGQPGQREARSQQAALTDRGMTNF